MDKIIKYILKLLAQWWATTLIIIVINWKIYERWIPVEKALIVGLLVWAAIWIIYDCIWALAMGAWRRKLLAVVILIGIWFVIFDVAYALVYNWLPRWGILLYVPDLEFRPAQFRARIMVNLVVIVLSSAVVLFFRNYVFAKLEVRRLAKEVEKLRQEFQKAVISPHFIESIMGTAIFRALLRSEKGAHESMEALAGIMRFVLDRQANAYDLVPLQAEWKQIDAMVRIARWKYGKDKVELRLQGNPGREEATVPVSMLTLVENAFKYADWEQEGAVSIRFTVRDMGYSFEVDNAIMADKQAAAGSKFGLPALRVRLAQSGLGIGLETSERNGRFFAKLYKKYT